MILYNLMVTLQQYINTSMILYDNDTSTILYNLMVICQRYKHDIIHYYPYRAFGGQNKIVYSTRFVRPAISF